MPSRNKQIIWQEAGISQADQEKLNGHPGMALWFTGLSGSGKSTLASMVARSLHADRCHTKVLDGDHLRHGLCKDLGFSQQDRTENIRRVAEAVRLFTETGTVVIAALISPLQSQREMARQIVGYGHFLEIFCDCPLEECEKRDPKGLYKQARDGNVEKFTGISSIYEIPENPALVLDTAKQSIEQCVNQALGLIRKRL